MSGPKDYAPPVSYSIHVFDGKLNSVFKLQAKLEKLLEECNTFIINDIEHQINLDCKNDLDKLKNNFKDALKPIVFNYKGRFGQDTYNHIEIEINQKLKLIESQIANLKSINENNINLYNDYQAYLSFLDFHNNTIQSYEAFKKQLKLYLINNISDSDPQLLKEVNSKIDKATIQIKNESFKVGFRNMAESLKSLLKEDVKKNEEQIALVRNEISNILLKKYNNNVIPLNDAKQDDPSLPEKQRLESKILQLIDNCEDFSHRKMYLSEFDKIRSSQSLQTIYHYKDFHDTILDSEKKYKIKKELNNLLTQINTFTCHKACENKRNELIKECLRCIESDKPAVQAPELIKKSFDILKTESDKQIENDEIQEKERQFLKSQIITSLSNMGYEVMDDLEVIDFENEDEFLLKIRNQENFLNLKFREDGSFRYVFQIPGKKEELSVDQQNEKLHDMSVTCDEFQSVLKDLKQMGLKIDLRSAIPVAYESIISVSDKNMERIKRKSKSKSYDDKKQEGKLYLDG
ncbi:MAG: hypothetical protein PHT69_00910 [Bacteroidales bacterium]|nr:hypothetical protein [Bacteroidales bacterium]